MAGNRFDVIYDCKALNGAFLPKQVEAHHEVAEVCCTPDKHGQYWVVSKSNPTEVLTVLNGREMCQLRQTAQVVQNMYGVVETTISM